MLCMIRIGLIEVTGRVAMLCMIRIGLIEVTGRVAMLCKDYAVHRAGRECDVQGGI